jgi:hypothetical protein
LTIFVCWPEPGPGTVEGGFVPTHHDHERGVARADVAAGDRRVERLHLAGVGRLRDLHRERGFARGHVDEQRTGPHGLHDPALAKQHLAHIGRVAEHREHDVALRGQCGRRVRPSRSVGHQLVGARPRAVEDGQSVPGAQQMSRHGGAHDAGTDPADGL